MLLMAPFERRRVVNEALLSLLFHRLKQVSVTWLSILQGAERLLLHGLAKLIHSTRSIELARYLA